MRSKTGLQMTVASSHRQTPVQSMHSCNSRFLRHPLLFSRLIHSKSQRWCHRGTKRAPSMPCQSIARVREANALKRYAVPLQCHLIFYLLVIVTTGGRILTGFTFLYSILLSVRGRENLQLQSVHTVVKKKMKQITKCATDRQPPPSIMSFS